MPFIDASGPRQVWLSLRRREVEKGAVLERKENDSITTGGVEMTEEQVAKWQARRDEAKRIEDPVAREKALGIVYDLKDDMQLDCQRKMADRMKGLVESDKEQRREINEIKDTVKSLEGNLARHEEDFKADHEVVNEVRERKLKVSGAMTALRWLGYVAAAGGGVAVKWILDAVNKAGGVQ